MPAQKIKSPYFPIVFIRGYAGTEAEVEETVATPYMGFNLGSTKVRQRWNQRLDRLVFESPLVRLMKDYEYRDVYIAGEQLPTNQRIPARSVIIYRYYDRDETSLGVELPGIVDYARGLSTLIERVRDAVCGKDKQAAKAFRVYLVAHSMGGLICRCLLQNPDVGKPAVKKLVDKVFTYATPHNGIDMEVIGNVPAFFTISNVNTFNRGKMREYLSLGEESERVDDLNGSFDVERFFCLVGTNSKDYEVANGWARRLVGPMSDGLVRIENAAVKGSPRAFVYRSHSGHYGIVNSEEGYQNLVRFLFGDVRIDGVLEVHELSLPDRVEKALKDGKQVRASYHFEVAMRPRGARYDLHRRTFDEESAIFRKFDDMLPPSGNGGTDTPRSPHLFSAFLSVKYRTKAKGPLIFNVDIRVLVPEYEVDGFLWFDDHLRGSYLYRETLTLGAIPPAKEGGDWGLVYGFDSQTPGKADRTALPQKTPSGLLFRIPLESTSKPGMKATLRIETRDWR